MGIIKEYAERAVQTETVTVPSPYADPAVVLVAPRGVALEPLTGHNSPSPDSAYAVPQSPSSPMLAPLVSRRLSRRRHARCPGGEIANRRVVSMPENKSEVLSYIHGKRVVSMPDRVRPVLEPSAELSQSSSTIAGDSFRSYNTRRERVCVFHTPSDVPQTPSPPSSPESLLIIASGTQLPEGFLRRKYSPEALIEEDEDWITWASSPPRPIPALHGPLSLPYARCPSGAEGTIIEEQDNVAQMIWGLGADDQPHSQVRVEGVSSHPDNSQHGPLHGPSQVPPRLQKKPSATQQVAKSSRIQISHTSHAKQNLTRQSRQAHDDKRSPLSQISRDIETLQDTASGLSWNEGQLMPINIGVPDHLVDDVDVPPVDDNRIMEWQLARLRQALRTSLADMESYASYRGRLEPVIPAAVAPGVPQSYPRIFVEPRLNELAGSSAAQSSMETAEQYRQQQLYRQALQKRKLQIQSLLPTPPNSSSPQWSSQFSPYLTCNSTFSPELVGSTEHLVPVTLQKYRSGASSSQHLRRVYGPHEHENVNDFDANTIIPSAKTSQTMPNANSVSSLRPSSSSSTLARYIKQLQALSPIRQFSPLPPAPPSNASVSPLPSTDESTGSHRTAYHTGAVRAPPSPESPQTIPQGSSYHNARPMASIRPMQQRLSSVPEEDSVLLELSTAVSPSRLPSQLTADGISSIHDRVMGYQARHLNVTRKSIIPELTEFESNVGVPCIPFHHETSPAKVRLPVTKEHNIREQTGGRHEQNREGHQHGHKKKHRYKKLKGPPATNDEQATTRGLVG